MARHSNLQQNRDNQRRGSDAISSNEQAMNIKSDLASDYQLLNKSFTDVTFIVGPPQHSKKFVGHRVLLAMTSPVFEAMFYGDMADKNKCIRVSDIAPIGFENVLRFAYTDSLNLNSVDDAMLTAYAAKKYLLAQLLNECLDYIEANVCASNACQILEFARVLSSQALILRSIQLIDRETEKVLTSKSFSRIQLSTLEFVANRKYLTLDSEFSLFASVVSWCKSELRRRNLPSDDWLAARAFLHRHSTTLSSLRLLSLTGEEFARACSISSALVTTGADLDGSLGANNGTNGESSTHLGEQVDVESANSLLTAGEQRAIFMNIAQRALARLPPTLCARYSSRRPPLNHFSVSRWSTAVEGLDSPLSLASATTVRALRSAGSKFEVSTSGLFLIGFTLPVRLAGSVDEPSSRPAPTFECQLRLTTRALRLPVNELVATGVVSEAAAAATSSSANSIGNQQQSLADCVDEALLVTLRAHEDCLVQLARPIALNAGNINELSVNFTAYAFDGSELLVLRPPPSSPGNELLTTIRDSEHIDWRFERTNASVEISRLHYYK